ncbi:BF3164 family lipoprotein [Maribellus sediminis]|uniref:BF3164 family lipoprotein n=1 Tax=Maribellus sediminis TaxID=2696285 RepID=UPI00142F8571|nr:BF3164 family lipoprotein [Maribellus sediminis]
MRQLFFTLLISATVLMNTTKLVNAQKTVNFEIDDFKEVIELKGEKLELKKPLRYPYEILLADTFLIVKNQNSSPAIDVFNLNNGELINQFCMRGRGPEELISPFSIQYIANTKRIMVQDFHGKKIVFYDLKSVVANSKKTILSTINISSEISARKIVVKQDGSFFCNLMGNPDYYMNCLLDQKGNFIKYLSKYPEIDTKYDPALGSNIFATNIGISNTGEYVVVPYRYSNKISIFNPDNEQVVNIIGPNFTKLHFVNKNNMPVLTSKNKCAYNIPSCGEKMFMVPYSGKPLAGEFNKAEHLFCFDYDGNVLKHFVVSPRITEIAVDWKNKIIYGANVDAEPTIYRFKF